MTYMLKCQKCSRIIISEITLVNGYQAKHQCASCRCWSILFVLGGQSFLVFSATEPLLQTGVLRPVTAPELEAALTPA